MEFEISADGELVAYHGTGGKVEIPEGVKFIAREGVFDKDCKITQLCLPSTLIGHKYDEHCSCPHVITKSASSDTLSVHRCKKSRAKSLAKDSLLFDVLCLDLPYLQSYVVSKDNKLYQAVDGVLIFLERVIVAVPACTPLPVKMELSYADYMRQAKRLRPYDQPPVTFNITGKSLGYKNLRKIFSLPLFASKKANLLYFFGPEIKHVNIIEQEVNAQFSEHNIVVITPNWMVEGSSQLTYRALCGFCHKPELYSGKIKDHYMRLMVRHERELYELSISKQLVMVRRFFNEMWRKPFDYQHEKSYLDDSTLLTEAVLRGTRKDISSILKQCKSIAVNNTNTKKKVNEPRTLMFLACRYGGYDKVRSLINSIVIRNAYYSDELKDFDEDSCAFLSGQALERKRKKYKNRYPTHRFCLNYLSSFEPLSDICADMYSDSNGDVRSYKPIAVEERFRCICYFLKATLYDYELKPWECFFSYMLDMSERKRNEITKELAFYGCVGLQDSRYSKRLFNALIIRALTEKPHNVVAFAKFLQQKNQLLPIHKSAVIAPLVDQNDIVFELMPLCKLDGECLTDFIKMLLEHDRIDTMSALLKTGVVEQHMTLSELRALIEDSNNPELQAVLLDYLHTKSSSGHSLRSDLTL